VVSERNQNLVKASYYLNQALKFDPLNTTYLLGVAVIQINTNQLSEAEETLAKVRDLDPNTLNLDSLTQILENQKDKS
jgi:predicted Zn-dependent protease